MARATNREKCDEQQRAWYGGAASSHERVESGHDLHQRLSTFWWAELSLAVVFVECCSVVVMLQHARNFESDSVMRRTQGTTGAQSERIEKYAGEKKSESRETRCKVRSSGRSQSNARERILVRLSPEIH
ncbi:MAG: hypothetical protein WD176_04955 [Pirellulales bacterium]